MYNTKRCMGQTHLHKGDFEYLYMATLTDLITFKGYSVCNERPYAWVCLIIFGSLN